MNLIMSVATSWILKDKISIFISPPLASYLKKKINLFNIQCDKKTVFFMLYNNFAFK